MKIRLDTRKGKFEQQDLQYVKLLEADKNFEDLITSARNNCGTANQLYNSYPSADLYAKALTCSQEIVSLYDLPSSWIPSLSDFIVMGTLPSPGSGIFLTGMTKDISSNRVSDLKVVIKQKVSFDELLNWIVANKKTIKKQLEVLPKKNSHIRINFKIKQEAFRLHNEGLKPKEILKELEQKYKSETDTLSLTEPEVSRWISRLKRTLKRLPVK